MYNPDTELLFPTRIIPDLAELREASWQKLVAEVQDQEEDSLEKLAFVRMMVKIDGCLTCNVDSYRAMRGCTDCAQQAIRRFKGSDQDLIKLYGRARSEIAGRLGK